MTHPSFSQPSKLLSAALLLVFAAGVLAEDHVVVYRVGDGVNGLVNTGSQVFLDEYAVNGTTAMLVRSIPMPTTANGVQKQLVASGTASSEGLLTRSTDGQYIILTGYATNIPYGSSLSGTASATIPRVVGRVDSAGNIDTSTALTDWADLNNPRSAASTNGTDIWVGGAAGYVRYAALSAPGTTTSTQLETDQKNIIQVKIFGGQLYACTQKGTTWRIAAVGTGTPTTTGQTVAALPGYSTSVNPESFFLANLSGGAGMDTLYVAEDGAGLAKYWFNGTNWIAKGTAGVGADTYFGLAGTVNGTTVTLYATRKTGSELVTITDSSGIGNDFTGTLTTLATAATNTAFRGVALGFATAGSADAGQSTVGASPASVPADDATTATITVTLKDANGNGFGGKTVTLAGNTGTSSTITPVNGGVTGSNGQATFTVKDAVVEAVTYTATDTTDSITVFATAQVSFIPVVGDAGQSTVNASPPSVVADGVAVSTITVTLKTSSGTAAANKSVSLAGAPGTSIITPGSGTTDANGQIAFTVKRTAAGAVTYTATDTTDTVTVTETALVTFTAGPTDAGASSATASSGSVVADGVTASTLTVTLKDANDNVVAGNTVTLAVTTGTSSTITPVNGGVSGSDGKATFTVTDTVVETVTYTATDTTASVTVAQTAQVAFTPGPVDAVQSTVSASLASVAADGVASSTITVTLMDANSHVLSGKTVALAGNTGTSSTITPVNGGVTGSDGKATFTVTDATAETVTYTATDTSDSVTVTPTVQVSFTAQVADAGQSTVEASFASVVGDGTATSTITVTLKDGAGAAVSGKAVSLAGSPTTSIITTLVGTTDANGHATFTVKSSVVGTVAYTATDTTDGVTVTSTAQVAFTPGGAPGTQLEIAIKLTITVSGTVSVAWGGGTTGKSPGDISPVDWTVQSATTGTDVGLSQTILSNGANNNIVMNLHNTSAGGTNARVSAAIPSSGGWSIGRTPGPDTFTIQAQLGSNADTVLSAAPQELTANAKLDATVDQALVVTVKTPTAVTAGASGNIGVSKTIFIVLTAAPE